jgi:hypothetical protein
VLHMRRPTTSDSIDAPPARQRPFQRG